MLTMIWYCLDCGEAIKKKDRELHEVKTGHTVSSKGVYFDKELEEIIQKDIVYPIVDTRIYEFTGDARKDYPKVYEILDTINGLRYINTLTK